MVAGCGDRRRDCHLRDPGSIGHEDLRRAAHARQVGILMATYSEALGRNLTRNEGEIIEIIREHPGCSKNFINSRGYTWTTLDRLIRRGVVLATQTRCGYRLSLVEEPS